ncbi:MAG: DNA methyltransferase [Saprospiraceae bacterium]
MELFLETRPDYTFKFNAGIGRHGWLRLTPAYSVKLVNQLLKNARPDELVFDPFSGTGTTGLVAAERGMRAVSTDINPFLIWVGNAKCRNYSPSEIAALKTTVSAILKKLPGPDAEEHWRPPIHNIERWWDSQTLLVLAKLRSLIVEAFGEPQQTANADLVWIAFSRLVIETSAAAFNHVSMSFKNGTRHFDAAFVAILFENIFQYICQSALQQLPGSAEIHEMDARKLETGQKFDRVITSPPYPNRISYIRELRPYMYWTKFLQNGSDAGEMDWKAIGGTWGIATSRLKNWSPQNAALPSTLLDVCWAIAQSGKPNADLMSAYVHKFFDDLYLHMKNLRDNLSSGAQIHYVLGNSSFYGVFVPSDSLTIELLTALGFINCRATSIRKRNSKKGLVEFCISAEWH